MAVAGLEGGPISKISSEDGTLVQDTLHWEDLYSLCSLSFLLLMTSKETQIVGPI